MPRPTCKLSTEATLANRGSRICSLSVHCPADERNLASSRCVVDARKGSGEKDEGSPFVLDTMCISRTAASAVDMLLQFEDVQMGRARDEEDRPPADDE